MNNSQQLLSDLIIYMKYARYIPSLGRRETWDEIIDRNLLMHLRKFPQFESEIREAYKPVYEKSVIPSARSLQFAGKPIEISPNRMTNCTAVAIDNWEVFSEIMFLLLGGSGVGYSLQFHHVDKLPEVKQPLPRTRRFLIGDSIEGWADSVRVLMKAYFFGQSRPVFDFSDIRAEGTPLITSGGRAPGPEPLRNCLYQIERILQKKEPGTKLIPIECHSILCHIADCVLSGGIRRAACMAIFSLDDEEMLHSKFDNWVEKNPHFGRANNSALMLRYKINKKTFHNYFQKVKYGGGDPGIFFSNSSEYIQNPCQPADATVLTPKGISTINKIQPGDTIWTGKCFSRVLEKWSTGIKPVYEFHTHAGTFIGTENHKIVSNEEKIEVQNAEEIDIAIGPEPQIHALYLNALIDGLVLGDGTVHEASNNLVGLCIGKDDQDYFTSPLRNKIKRRREDVNSYFYEIETSITAEELPKTYLRKIPTRYFTARPEEVCSLLKGLYSANGSIVSNRVTLKASSFMIINQVQQLLSSLGIRSYYTTNKSHEVEFQNGTYTCKESYDLNITTDRHKFKEFIGFLQTDKQERLNKICDNFQSNRSKKTYQIVSKKYRGEEEVFDLTVESPDHTYWTGGLLVSNCGEVSLPASGGICNLTTFNIADSPTATELLKRVRSATVIATLQATYTDFHYLRGIWKRNAEKEALIGVSPTGLATRELNKIDLRYMAEVVNETNKQWAEKLGIRTANRTTVVKPAGTTSLVMATSSGIHSWFAPYYIRRVQVLKNEAVYKYFKKHVPELVEDYFGAPNTQAIISIPVEAPSNAIVRGELALTQLNRIKKVYEEWIKPGHRKGDNTNNVSATVFVKEDEWEEVEEWMWKNRDSYNGIALFPYSSKSYRQAPHEEITEEKYRELSSYIRDLDFKKILEEEDNTDLVGEIACSGDACSIVS